MFGKKACMANRIQELHITNLSNTNLHIEQWKIASSRSIDDSGMQKSFVKSANLNIVNWSFNLWVVTIFCVHRSLLI